MMRSSSNHLFDVGLKLLSDIGDGAGWHDDRVLCVICVLRVIDDAINTL